MDSLERVSFHAEHTGCYTYFSITGDFDPKEITDLLGLEPEETWKKGDPRRYGIGTLDFSAWEFGMCREYDGIVEHQMKKTIAPLFEKRQELKEIREKFQVAFTLQIVPTVRFDEFTPCLSPSMEVMKFCCETGTEISIDLYVSCPDGPKDGEVWEI